MTARGHTESQCPKCHQGVVEVPKAERLNTGDVPGRAVRLPRLPQDQGLGGAAQGRPGPDEDREQDHRGVDLPLDQGAQGFRPTRMPQVWDVRIDETAGPEGPEQRRGQRGGRLHRGEVGAGTPIRRRPRATCRPGARPSRPSAAWPATGSATTAAGSTPDARRTCEGARRAAFRTHGPNLDGTGSKVNAGLALLLGARPQGLLARDADAEPAAHREGGRGHHGLPDEPQERRLHGPAAAGRWTPSCATPSCASTWWPSSRCKQADQKLGRDGRPGSARSSWARRRSAATAASAATPSRASRRPRPSAWS